MANEEVTQLGTITVEASRYGNDIQYDVGQDDGDGDGYGSGSVSGSVSAAQSFLGSLNSDPAATAQKYNGANAIVNLARDAAKAGVDVFIVGENHLDTAANFNKIATMIRTGIPISVVTLEIDPEMNQAIMNLRNGVITKQEFIEEVMHANPLAGTMGVPAEQTDPLAAQAMYGLVMEAEAKGIPVVAADFNSRQILESGVSKNSLAERLDDAPTYDALKSAGLFDRPGMVVSHQGSAHVTNGAGNAVKGMDDLAKKDGLKVLTVTTFSEDTLDRGRVNLATAEKLGIVQLGNDAADVTIVDGKTTVGKTQEQTWETDRATVQKSVNDRLLLTSHVMESLKFDQTIYAKSGKTTYTGSSGKDLFVDKSGVAMKINGGNGIDTVSYIMAAGAVNVDLLTPGQNTGIARGDTYSSIENISGTNHNDDLRGNNGANAIDGGFGNDIIYGRDGNDKLYGGLGNDTLNGGNGNDTLIGDFGRDKLYGDSGNDKLYGGDDNDILYGDAGDDELSGGNANDTLYGGTGHDELKGDGGTDKLYGEGGNDVLYGGNGDDLLLGGTGNDTLYGGNHDDALSGGAGDDKLNGGTGNDRLIGGDGNDTLTGGGGKDMFFFDLDSGVDHIVDFQDGQDYLMLYSGTQSNPFGYYQSVQSGADVKITWGESTIYIEDTKLSQISVITSHPPMSGNPEPMSLIIQ